MIDLKSFQDIITAGSKKGGEFRPRDIDINSPRNYGKGNEYDKATLEEEDVQVPIKDFNLIKCDRKVIGIDGTSFKVGETREGIISAVRVVAVEKDVDGSYRVNKVGPFLGYYTVRNKDEIYKEIWREIYGKNPAKAPKCERMPDRIRNFLERYVQMEYCMGASDSIILLDGSLKGTVSTPVSFIREMMKKARRNGSDVVAIAKESKLRLEKRQRSIHSVTEDEEGPIMAHVGPYLEQRLSRYLGKIYSVKFSRYGEPFRVDIPDDTTEPHKRILAKIADLTGKFGYPDELRMAHSYSKLDPVEILELQAATSEIYGLDMKEDLREKILGPLG